ncbi:MAG: hypothetical protein COZ46_02685 [Verrucomicrobia bacterium CG_4_10_14_3_um_filter_43_23]|nr:MAG: hypothetical protein AUJ82_06090 [Verrucomicrobia bacterium CG1_02_43_26]PIP60067.1 MAG: hypothetical protein COX01_00465 [Verrucomicrobia bacterium CG22_combo_CG10-13_8_21_14_all_43_17]PIX58686.1 MAG: hypothetical protein COZ46_02685 [Verrucomicrobia bacterium CG_4_10_14_3_um_filter_43_23]PIY62635.1 MAG: hypothetical protein COY94_01470 [Verrucomicrobia bacterium CG_4_10_14_0_8_um_filter_43_34]PJA43292.1 MAG: hypothetical protein CO175_08710 [Verrucomicrobia bacterium CG_4_9_14_3_um_fi
MAILFLILRALRSFIFEVYLQNIDFWLIVLLKGGIIMKLFEHKFRWLTLGVFLMLFLPQGYGQSVIQHPATGDTVYAPEVDSRLALTAQPISSNQIYKVVLTRGSGAQNAAVWLSLGYQFDRNESEYNDLTIFVDGAANRAEILVKGDPLMLKDSNNIAIKEYAFVLAMDPNGPPTFVSLPVTLPLNGSASVVFENMQEPSLKATVTIQSQYKDSIWSLSIVDAK